MTYSIDLKYLKKSIKDFLFSHAVCFKGVVLDVGCGEMPYKKEILGSCPGVEKYLGLDLDNNYADRGVTPDLVWDGTKIPLPDSAIHCAFATEVLEHCPEPGATLSEIQRVLKPGGAFLFTVPYLWPLHEVPYDFYRYTPFSLQKLLEDSGFDSIDIEILGGWDASLAQMLGLWVVRRPGLHRVKRKLLTKMLTPAINYLVSKDNKPSEFVESQMLTGLCGVARKDS